MQNCGIRSPADGHFFGNNFGGVDEKILTQKAQKFILTWAVMLWYYDVYSLRRDFFLKTERRRIYFNHGFSLTGTGNCVLDCLKQGMSILNQPPAFSNPLYLYTHLPLKLRYKQKRPPFEDSLFFK